MKIIHTSDWHLGQHFFRFDRNDEHRFFIDQLCDIVKNRQPDALLVSGDIFDNVAPTAPTQKLFVESILTLHDACKEMVIVVTAGNHDSGPRLEVTKQLWQQFGVHLYGSCLRNEDGTFNPAQYVLKIKDCGFIIAAPYFHSSNYPALQTGMEREQRKQSFYQTLIDEAQRQNTSQLPIVMMAHLAVSGSDVRGHDERLIGDMDQEPLSALGHGYDYLALGHIHKPQTLNHSNQSARYSGSPIPLSFTEDYEHSVSYIEIPAHQTPPTIESIPILPLRKVKTIPENGENLETALKALSQLDDTDNSYIRLLIDQEGILPADAEHRANAITQEKQCRFCEIRKVIHQPKDMDQGRYKTLNVEELKEVPPLDIAAQHYKHTQGCDLNEELTKLMRQAIEEVAKEETQHS